MSSEWMKVMLEEIARKRSDREQERAELERRRPDNPATLDGDAAPAERGPAERGPGSRAPG